MTIICILQTLKQQPSSFISKISFPKFAKAIFSQVSVCPQGGGGHAWQGAVYVVKGGICGKGSVHGEEGVHGEGGIHGEWQACMVGVCMTGGVHGKGGVLANMAKGACMAKGGGACMVKGACVAKGGTHGKGGHAWQERRPLQQALHILLGCILVIICDN